MQTKYGSFVTFTFLFIWLVGPLALLPMSLAKDQKRVAWSEMTAYPWWQWLLLVPFLVHDGTAKVPRWISIPLIAIALLLSAFIFIVLTIVGLRQLLA